MMSKLMVATFAGVFLGALAVELVSRKRPDLIDDLHVDVDEMMREFRDAFREGYAGGYAEREPA